MQIWDVINKLNCRNIEGLTSKCGNINKFVLNSEKKKTSIPILTQILKLIGTHVNVDYILISNMTLLIVGLN